ncbi:FAD-binding oxidoreductase [Microbacterium aurantiacum]|uniref:FAD-linked oxidase n=1 Tax=Microbacterium aurantiacum TaxID=162393 RepID=A0A0M8MLX5_9MICO|nr:FAD-linked oxidase C-terminal domain-containing protein [Microbacterium chocolatum]ANG85155.1 FAD-linked oxidase [Microbacterium chocolatum]KOS10134.1 FAD-linked oxidase [Microbacterium chocolatum]
MSTPDARAPGPADVVALLQRALGERVDTDPAVLRSVRADKSGHAAAGTPLAVVHAASVTDVQETLRIASATGTPVVTRGAGTGLAGGANAGAGEIALSVRRMDRILDIRPDDLVAVVEPGIINADLNAALLPHGLWWAPDPASRAISTVGGNIATGAGGLLCAKYGVVRDAVLGVDVVLADGRLLHLGRGTVKGVTGLDLTALMIGSEGTLGVIVGATLKLRRVVPGETRTLAATFARVGDAARASAAVTAAGLQPAVMELMDAAALAAVHDLLALPAPTHGAVQLTVQTDGPAADEEARAIAEVLRTRGGTVVVAVDAAEGERLLAIRRSLHPAMERLGTTLIEDVCVPRSALPAMFDEIARIERERDLRIPTVAHAGDGNLHPNFIFDVAPGPDGVVEVPAAIWEAADELFRAALRLGGTLTGEHGVGVLKRRWLADELGEDQWRLQREITAVFDPAGILNPGKVFAPAAP